MDIHKNARLTLKMRELLAQKVILEGLTLKQAAACLNVSANTAGKWVRRYRLEGAAGMHDGSCRPHRLHRLTAAELVEHVRLLRLERWTGLRIAQHTALSRATVSRILRRLKLNRMRDLEPRPAVQRYEHAAAGDLLHLDIKKLGRFRAEGMRIHGDPSRFPNEQAASPAQFLAQALAYYARLGIRFKAVLTDNGPAYASRHFAQTCRQLALKHRRTRPYTPRTNGKAERFIQTALREWAYGRPYQNSQQRAQALPAWLHQYNWHRPHAGIAASPPIARSGLGHNNLLTHHK